jgi:hypothetical protein
VLTPSVDLVVVALPVLAPSSPGGADSLSCAVPFAPWAPGSTITATAPLPLRLQRYLCGRCMILAGTCPCNNCTDMRIHHSPPGNHQQACMCPGVLCARDGSPPVADYLALLLVSLPTLSAHPHPTDRPARTQQTSGAAHTCRSSCCWPP